jgi:hypothetical protein
LAALGAALVVARVAGAIEQGELPAGVFPVQPDGVSQLGPFGEQFTIKILGPEFLESQMGIGL